MSAAEHSGNGLADLADLLAHVKLNYIGDFGPSLRGRVGKAMVPESSGANLMEEYGRSGLRHWGGFVFEEWLRELQQGQRAAQVFREMQDQDPIIGAIVYAITMLIRRVTWWVDPADSSREAQQGADWFEQNLHDMRHAWPDTLGEIFSFPFYGWGYHEEVYKVRKGESRNRLENSKFDDGTIGLAKLPLRSQDSLWKWVFDDVGEIVGMIQNPPPDYLLRFVPLEKAVLFRTSIFKDNPEGRALAADCPIPTPLGWTPIGELRPGDRVYDERGRVRYVTASARWDNRPCYEVVFSGGHSVIADAEHLWSVTTFNDRSGAKAPRILTTAQMAEHLGRTRPVYSAGIAPTLDGVSGELPVDPYILGYWLGDGNHRSAAIACSAEDFPSLRENALAAGYEAAHDGGRGCYISGLKPALRRLEVLGNKHIPRGYLRASAPDRLALLQGLMDSDGTVDRDGGCRFYNTNPRLLAGFQELVRSLGGVPRTTVACRPGRSGGVVNGRPVVATKTLRCVTFSLPTLAFRLRRKAERHTPRSSNRTQGHNIREIRQVASRQTVCIEVDSPSHLFLAGEGMVPTHNSVLRTAYRPWYFLRNIQNIEGIGVERDLAGLPMLEAPEGTDIWDQNDPSMVSVRQQAQNLVSSIRRDEQEGIVVPSGWKLSLLSTGGRRQFDTTAIVTRYETRIATSVLADLVMMGQQTVGSYALAVTKKDLFAASLGAYLDIVASQFNSETIPRLWRLNQFKGPMPKLMHGAVETVDLDTLGNYIMRLGQSGAPIDWETVLPWAMEQGGIPKPPPTHDFTPRPVGGAGIGSTDASPARATAGGAHGGG